jgi:hypothetical protein
VKDKILTSFSFPRLAKKWRMQVRVTSWKGYGEMRAITGRRLLTAGILKALGEYITNFFAYTFCWSF